MREQSRLERTELIGEVGRIHCEASTADDSETTIERDHETLEELVARKATAAPFEL